MHDAVVPGVGKRWAEAGRVTKEGRAVFEASVDTITLAHAEPLCRAVAEQGGGDQRCFEARRVRTSARQLQAAGDPVQATWCRSTSARQCSRKSPALVEARTCSA